MLLKAVHGFWKHCNCHLQDECVLPTRRNRKAKYGRGLITVQDYDPWSDHSCVHMELQSSVFINYSWTSAYAYRFYYLGSKAFTSSFWGRLLLVGGVFCKTLVGLCQGCLTLKDWDRISWRPLRFGESRVFHDSRNRLASILNCKLAFSLQMRGIAETLSVGGECWTLIVVSTWTADLWEGLTGLLSISDPWLIVDDLRRPMLGTVALKLPREGVSRTSFAMGGTREWNSTQSWPRGWETWWWWWFKGSWKGDDLMKSFSDRVVEIHDGGDESFLGPVKRRWYDETF
jgi:hypothetical protein